MFNWAEMNYSLTKKFQNEDLRLVNEIRKSLIDLSQYNDFACYARGKYFCFNCLRLIDSLESHKCINNQVFKNILILNLNLLS